MLQNVLLLFIFYTVACVLSVLDSSFTAGSLNGVSEQYQRGNPPILHIKVCLQVLGSTSAHVKKVYKPFVAPGGAAPSLIIASVGLRTTSLKIKIKSGGVDSERSELSRLL